MYQYLNSYSKLFASLCCFLFLAGCVKDKKEDNFPRNVDFYIRYLSEGDQFNSLCKITYADSVATGESDTSNYDITVSGNDMKQIIANNGNKHYNLKTKLPFKNSYEIKIKDKSGDILSQQTKLFKIDSLILDNKISIGKGSTLKYAGTPLDQDESLILMVVSKDGKTSSTDIKGPTTNNEVMLQPQNMTMLSAGMADVYLIRVYSSVITNEDFTFYFRNEYFSKTYKIELLP